MKIYQVRVFLSAALLFAPAALAQEATSFVFGQYYRCQEATETRADAIYQEVAAPLLQQEVEAGRLTTYGWARHWMGGEWRRLEYVIGTDLDAMVDARQAYIDKLFTEHAKSTEEFSSICPSHDDYIWSVVASSLSTQDVGRDRSPVGMSTYFECDEREGEADAIVETAFAPILNQQVKEGKIQSWSWLRHLAGGEYRRILVIDVADHKSALNYWSSPSALDEQQPELSRRFTEICSSHTDYIWDMGAN